MEMNKENNTPFKAEDVNWDELAAIGILKDELEMAGELDTLLSGEKTNVVSLSLVLLGVGCWRQNLDVPGLLVAGIALHAFGVLHIAFAGLVTGLATTLDYALPVLAIQKRLRLLLRVQVLNSNLCGAPWWVPWVLVVIGFAGLSPQAAQLETPTWIWISRAIGIVGTLATWWWSLRGTRGPRDPLARMDDGADGIRRNLRVYDDLERFERE